jgi:hypothetical protein
MRLLAEKLRFAYQAAAFPHAVPPPPEKPDSDAGPDEDTPSRYEPRSSSSQN